MLQDIMPIVQQIATYVLIYYYLHFIWKMRWVSSSGRHMKNITLFVCRPYKKYEERSYFVKVLNSFMYWHTIPLVSSIAIWANQIILWRKYDAWFEYNGFMLFALNLAILGLFATGARLFGQFDDTALAKVILLRAKKSTR